MNCRQLLSVFFLAVTLLAWQSFAWGATSQKAVVLIVRPSGSDFDQAAHALTAEMKARFDITQFNTGRRAKHRAFQRCMEREEPALLVLLGNQSVDLYRNFLAKQTGRFEAPASLVLMVVDLEKELAGLPFAAGIKYEVQGLTSLVHLRALVKQPIRRVGVIYRRKYAKFFEEQRQLCDLEQITLIGALLEDGPWSRRRLKRTLLELTRDGSLDAIWVLNDEVILRDTWINKVWRPSLEEFQKPVVVGIEALVEGDQGMGNLAVVPDHFSLGHQAAGLVLEAAAADWRFEKTIHQAIGVNTILNLRLFTDDVSLRSTNLLEIDRIIQR